jgi:hypothetical protein
MIKFYKRTQYVILYIISLVLIGVTSLIDKDSGINFGNLQSFTWYVDQIITSFAIITTVMATVYMIVDNFKLNDKEYVKIEQDLKDFADKEYVPTMFARFLEYINPKRKRLQHEHNTKKALFALDRKVKDEDLFIWNNGTPEQKRKNKYCRQRLKFEERLTEEWINRNLMFVHVPYDKITSSLVLGGYFSKDENNSPNEFVTKFTEGKIVKDKLPILVLGIAITSIASSIIVTLLFDDSALLSVLTKLFVLLFQIYNSIKYANDWTVRITLKDARFRKSVAQEFKIWLKQLAIQESNKVVQQNANTN